MSDSISTPIGAKNRFPLGQAVITANARELIPEDDVFAALTPSPPAMPPNYPKVGFFNFHHSDRTWPSYPGPDPIAAMIRDGKTEVVITNMTKDGELLLNYGQMFSYSSEWIQTARRHTLSDHRHSLVTAVVIDVGAFTTDLAAVTFDVAEADELGGGLQGIGQESHPLGVIDHLDRPLFAALAQQHGLDWAEVSFKETELVKRSIYGGGAYSMLTKKAGVVELGQRNDRRVVESHLNAFADAVGGKVSLFLRRKKPSVIFMTGGGSLIPSVVAQLSKRVRRRGVRIAVLDDAERNPSIKVRWQIWEKSGESLQRVATSVGGSSVILQTVHKEIHSGSRRPFRRRPSRTSEQNIVPCWCQGGNKDCCFCSGRGFYRRR